MTKLKRSAGRTQANHRLTDGAAIPVMSPAADSTADRSRTMKKQGRLTISILTFGVLVVGGWALPALGQGGNPPASTKESGQTSGRGETAVEQIVKGSDTSVAQALIALENKWAEEAKNGNADGVARLLANDFVETDADSSVHNREQALALIKTGKWEANQISDLKVAVYGKAAVVTGTWLGKGTSNGKRVDARERWTDTWIRMPNGRWQCVASHSSAIK